MGFHGELLETLRNLFGTLQDFRRLLKKFFEHLAAQDVFIRLRGFLASGAAQVPTDAAPPVIFSCTGGESEEFFPSLLSSVQPTAGFGSEALGADSDQEASFSATKMGLSRVGRSSRFDVS